MTATVVARDVDFEHAFLTNTVTWAKRTENLDPAAFAGAVLARLAKGEGEYEHNGRPWYERTWRELFAEAAQEPPDGTAWLMLTLQKLAHAGISDDDFQALVMCAHRASVHMAAADHALRDFERIAGELVAGQ